MALERNVMLARAQHAHVDMLEGKDPVETILDYAREHGITQIFVGHNLRRAWRNRLAGTPLDRLIRDAEGIDVRVFPHRRPMTGCHRDPERGRGSRCSSAMPPASARPTRC